MTKRATPLRVVAVTLGSLATLGGAMLTALVLGVERVDLWRALAEPTSNEAAILLDARLPRVLAGALVGAALGPAGVAFQALLRNPLADPYVLGVSGGAAALGSAGMVLAGAGAFGMWTRPLFAFSGALVAILAVLTFGRLRGRLVPGQALLAGVVLNAFCAAAVMTLQGLAAPDAANRALRWLLGSLGGLAPVQLAVLGAYVALGLLALWRMAVPMNAFALGEDAAHVLGIDPARGRLGVFLTASLLTGAAVAFAGPIGFVGIVVPHALRRLVGADHRVLVPAAALGGAAFLVAADAAARLSLLAIDDELPVGALSALVGAPFFLVILKRRGAERAF